MFIIEGMDKVKETIKKNRARKRAGRKKLSNNSVIEIDNISPIEFLKLQVSLTKIAKGENIVFNEGKGQKKSEHQKLHEEIEACRKR